MRTSRTRYIHEIANRSRISNNPPSPLALPLPLRYCTRVSGPPFIVAVPREGRRRGMRALRAWRPALRFPPRGLPRTHRAYLGGVPGVTTLSTGPRPGRRRSGVCLEGDPIRLNPSDRSIALWTPSLLSRGQRAGFAHLSGQRRACQTRRPWEKRLVQPRPAQILARSIYVRYSNACRRA